MKTKHLSVKYELDGKYSHSSNEIWESTELHCMNCGFKSVWKSQDEDYYVGPSCLCTQCGFHWDLPSEPIAAEDDQFKQRWTELKNVPVRYAHVALPAARRTRNSVFGCAFCGGLPDRLR